MGIASAAGIDEAQTLNRSPEREACFETASYAALASLPPGLVVTEIDYGPFLLALTPHAVMGAPYHRLSVGIVAAHRAFASPPEEARGILARLHATYVATCGPRSPSGLAGAAERASLWGQLQAGAAPDWLQPIPLPTTPFKLYRVAG
jgi:hypothetical protein